MWGKKTCAGRLALGALLGSTMFGCAGPARTLQPHLLVEPPPVAPGRVPPAGAYEPGFDALHYRIQLALPDSGSFIRGTTTADILITTPRRDTLRLDLSGLLVTAVQVGQGQTAPAAAPFWQADGRLFVSLPARAHSGDTLHVEVHYQGHPDDGLIIGSDIHGDRAIFADDWPDRARFWFPCIDHPSDKATVEFEVRAPEQWAVVANGTRTGAEAARATPPVDGVWRWHEGVPIPTYTMVIGATAFAVGTVASCAPGGVTALRPNGCVPISYWVYPEDSARAAPSFQRAGEIVAFFSDLIAPYPYGKLAHVQSATRFGGMENASAIFYAQRPLAQGRNIEGTVAHETAHQWFGDAVTERNWHHLWLSEGFATYFSALFFEHADGQQRFRAIMRATAQEYFASDVTNLAMVDTTAVPDGNLLALLNANSYQKGAMVLHMLRRLLGDDAFFEGIRRYYRAHVYDNAVTADLEGALEEASGKRLDWFFRQWVYRPGYPIVTLQWHWDATRGDAVLELQQVQNAAWPTFRVPLDIEFHTAAGSVRRQAELNARQQTLHIPLDRAPSGVQLDPDGWELLRVVTAPGS